MRHTTTTEQEPGWAYDLPSRPATVIQAGYSVDSLILLITESGGKTFWPTGDEICPARVDNNGAREFVSRLR